MRSPALLMFAAFLVSCGWQLTPPPPAGAPSPTAPASPASAAPAPTATQTPSCEGKIKGNISSTGEKIYHMPGQRFYDQTIIEPSKGERWFCTEDEAQRAGWRKSRVEDIRPGALQPALVLRVIDGDTIEADVDGTVERVRYAGIDTPERGERCADEATQRNAALVGRSVFLEASHDDRDKYGRLVRYVWTEDRQSVDQMLLAEGYGHAWYGPGPHRAELIATADEANGLLVGCLFAQLAVVPPEPSRLGAIRPEAHRCPLEDVQGARRGPPERDWLAMAAGDDEAIENLAADYILKWGQCEYNAQVWCKMASRNPEAYGTMCRWKAMTTLETALTWLFGSLLFDLMRNATAAAR